MALPKDNRVILLVGAGVAIVIAVVLALIFTGGGDKTTEAPPASKGGLVVNLAEAPTLEPTRELRCFVDGQFVGMATLAVCAQRNGLATDALDVGLDATGALAAAPTAAFAPPPELPAVEMAQTPPPATPAPAPARPAPAAAPAARPALTPAQQAQVQKQDAEMSAAALQVAHLIDANRAGEAWKGASAVAKKSVTEVSPPTDPARAVTSWALP